MYEGKEGIHWKRVGGVESWTTRTRTLRERGPRGCRPRKGSKSRNEDTAEESLRKALVGGFHRGGHGEVKSNEKNRKIVNEDHFLKTGKDQTKRSVSVVLSSDKGRIQVPRTDNVVK